MTDLAPSARNDREPAASQPLLRATGLRFEHPRCDRPAIHDVGLELHRGEVLVVLGPNGAGKSTLLALCGGLLKPDQGHVELCGEDLRRLSQRRRARLVARLPQELETWPRQSVAAFVAGGRYAHAGRGLDALAADDLAAIDQALAAVGATAWRDRPLTDLSGGERQRLLVARALAQQPTILLCDEPTASLDVAAQLEVLELLVAATGLDHRDEGRARCGVLLVTHDLNLAAQFGDRVLLLDAGRAVATGTAEQVLCAEVLKPLYGEALHFEQLPADGAPGAGRPLVVPRRVPPARSESPAPPPSADPESP